MVYRNSYRGNNMRVTGTQEKNQAVAKVLGIKTERAEAVLAKAKDGTRAVTVLGGGAVKAHGMVFQRRFKDNNNYRKKMENTMRNSMGVQVNDDEDERGSSSGSDNPLG